MLLLKHKVSEVPSFEEYFGLDVNFIEDEEFDPDNDDEDIKKLLALVLSLLQEFYIEYMYASEQVIASEEFKMAVDKFNEELKDSLIYLFLDYIEKVNNELAFAYDIPVEVLENQIIALKTDIDNSVVKSVDAVTNTLYYDLLDKASFYTDMALTTGTFAVHGNFRRALRKLTNAVDYKAQYAKSRAERIYLEFVYGQEALFQWNVTGVNTCAWCYEMEAMGAMPLSWFPADHPNGRCWLTPVNPKEYSDEYNNLKGW